MLEDMMRNQRRGLLPDSCGKEDTGKGEQTMQET